MRKLTRQQKQHEEDHLWGADLVCKTAVLLMACVLGIPAILLIAEWACCRVTKNSILHNMINSKN
jgi:hypothetical protein